MSIAKKKTPPHEAQALCKHCAVGIYRVEGLPNHWFHCDTGSTSCGTSGEPVEGITDTQRLDFLQKQSAYGPWTARRRSRGGYCLFNTSDPAEWARRGGTGLGSDNVREAIDQAIRLA